MHWEGKDQVVLFGCMFVYGNPDPSYNNVDTYDTASGSFSAAGAHVPVTDPDRTPRAYSLAGGLIYYVTLDGRVFKYNLAKNTNTQIGGFVSALEAERAGAVNPVDGVLLAAPGTGTQPASWTSYSIDSGAETSRNAAINLSSGGQGALEWDPIGNRWIYCPADCSALYAISRTFVRTTLVSSGMPTAPQNGLYGKFRLFPELNGGGWLNNYSGNVVFVGFD
jgi:hypothetical protein